MSTIAPSIRHEERTPVWQLAVASFFPAKSRPTVTSRARHLPLALIMLIQVIGSVRLSNTAFRDEGLYVWTGYRMFEYWFQDAVLYDRPSTYFSGAPAFYPPIAAALDMVGGLTLVRAFSLLWMLAATAAIYSMASRIFERKTGLWAAFAFAVAGPVHHLGWFATFDAMALGLLAIAGAVGVRSIQRRRTGAAVLVGTLLALAVFAKYASAMFVPVVLLVLVLSSARKGRAFGFAALAGTVTAALVGAVVLFTGPGRSAIQGVLFSTVDRTAMQPATVGDIAADAWQYAGPSYLLALVGLVASAVYLRRGLLPLVLLGGAVAPVAYQAYIGEGVSLSKHIAFGLIFAAPLIGLLYSTTKRLWQRILVLAAAVWMGLFGLSVSHFLYGEWSNTEPLVDTLSYSFEAAPYMRTLGDVYEPVRYAYTDSTEFWQWDTTDSIFYDDPELGELRGIEAAKAGLEDAHWQLVYLNHSTGISQELIPLMESYGYEQTNAVRLENNRGEDTYLIFQNWTGLPE